MTDMTDMTEPSNRIVGGLVPDRPAHAHARILPIPFVLRLQRTIGNRAVLDLLAPSPVPASTQEPAPPSPVPSPSPGWFSRVTSAVRRLSPSSF